jgi:sigma-B regulation protein RsbU (phosphoserine phosphatase)
VGLFDDAEYTDLTQQLEPEFKLLLSSDGIFEILPCDQIADKEEQLRKILQQSNSRLEGLVDALNINDIDAVPDDIALLSICGEAHA